MTTTEVLIAAAAMAIAHERSIQQKWVGLVEGETGGDVAMTWRPPATGHWHPRHGSISKLLDEALTSFRIGQPDKPGDLSVLHAVVSTWPVWGGGVGPDRTHFDLDQT